jgi:hypothetical protein
MRIFKTFQMIRHLRDVIIMGNRKMIFRCFIGIFSIAILFVSIGTASAANWYVRKGATGSNNGSNWTNAWNEMNQIRWTSVLPGDTIWLAGGTYTTQLKPEKSGTSVNRIYVKRVRTTDTVPVAAAGWSSSFDSQVIINTDRGIAWESGTSQLGSYVTIDGRIDSGIKSVYPEINWGSSAIFMNTANTGVTIQYVDAAGPGGATAYTHADDTKAVQLRTNAANLTIRHCRLHGGVDQLMILGPTDLTVEYCKLYDNVTANSSTYHPGLVASRICYGTTTYRYNEHYNYQVEGLMLGASSGDIGCTWKIYGNIFHSPADTVARAVEVQYANTTVYAYNNTIVGLSMGFRAINGAIFGAGSRFDNNIFYNVGTPFLEGTIGLHDFNAYSGTNSEMHGISNIPSAAFINFAGGNFNIVSAVGTSYPKNKGITLSSEYSTDMNGVVRGSDGMWDIGAYEHGIGGILPPNQFRRITNP